MIITVVFCFFTVLSQHSLAQIEKVDALIISDIRIEGLQRVSAESIFAVLPIDVGERLEQGVISQTIQNIFATGNFKDVEVGTDNTIVIIKVLERPSISEIKIDGNKAITTEALLDGLKAQGMSEGRVFQRATLDNMRKELSRQYGSQGRYDAEIKTDVITQPRNRVLIDIQIDEGSSAKIKHINIVGNQIFSDKKLKKLMELKDKGLWSRIKGKKKYSREKLSGDLENISDYYRDQGYIEFQIKSAQVSVGPEKKRVFINLVVSEGELYQFNDVSLVGDVKEQREILNKLLIPRKGSTFSQAQVTSTEELIKRHLGNQGFAFAEVRGIPELNEEERTVDIVFFVEPQKRQYVRRINFFGNQKTRDEVLRREMRQMEGNRSSTSEIESSRVRLERLGYFEEVKVETNKVPGSDDLVDVDFTVTEQSFGSISASVGYSEGAGVVFSGSFQQKNFLGSGKELNLSANRSRFRTSYSLTYVNPYYTPDGVSRGFSIFARETDFDEINVTSFSTNSYGGSVIFGYPLSETQFIRFTMGYTRTELETGFAVVQEIQRTPSPEVGFDPGLARKISIDQLNDSLVFPNDFELTTIDDFDLGEPGFVDLFGDQYDVFSFSASWRESTLNRGIFPTRGHSNILSLEVTAPGVSDVEYYKLSFKTDWYFKVPLANALRLKAEIGYGDGFGDNKELPFFEHFFAGGLGSVRGYDSNSLGPKSTPAERYEISQPPNAIPSPLVYVTDANGNLLTQRLDTPDPFGGNILVETSAELIIPTPFVGNASSVRTVMFYDMGNVFSSNCRSTQENCSNFKFEELRQAAGFSLTWLSGFGPLSFSFGFPLNDKEGDDTQFFEFSLGGVF